jgi:hypothetical protein
MICVSAETMQAKATKMPIGYLQDCQAVAVIKPQSGHWCFDPADFDRIRNKYRGFAVSAADPYRERISGCCDRADQY